MIRSLFVKHNAGNIDTGGYKFAPLEIDNIISKFAVLNKKKGIPVFTFAIPLIAICARINQRITGIVLQLCKSLDKHLEGKTKYSITSSMTKCNALV